MLFYVDFIMLHLLHEKLSKILGYIIGELILLSLNIIIYCANFLQYWFDHMNDYRGTIIFISFMFISYMFLCFKLNTIFNGVIIAYNRFKLHKKENRILFGIFIFSIIILYYVLWAYKINVLELLGKYIYKAYKNHKNH